MPRTLSVKSLSCLAFILLLFMAHKAPAQAKKDFAIVIHGGAGGDPDKWTEEYRQQRRNGLSAALDRGVELLRTGTSALDVVEQVVRVLEDDETFNAGRGCVLNALGEHELDASIMDGSHRGCGAVAGVRRARHPISLARKVMSETKHVLLFGAGADELAEDLGLELAEDSYFRTARQLDSWQRWKNKEIDASLHRPHAHPAGDQELYLGTVGCVALDRQGNLAAATSTGGLLGKRSGRVGDSPIIGAGNYADNATCAVSGTGVGEEFIRHTVAAEIAAQMRYAGKPLADAARSVISELPENCGGVIALDGGGNVVVEFNTPGMSRAFADSSETRGIHLGRQD